MKADHANYVEVGNIRIYPDRVPAEDRAFGFLKNLKRRAATLAAIIVRSILADPETGRRDLERLLTLSMEKEAENERQAKIIMDQRREITDLKRCLLTDAMTGIPNKLSLEFALKSLCAEHKNDERRTAKGDRLLMIDLDGFKRLNDTYGHEAGDVALCKVAEFLQSTFKRKTDVVCRRSGDEFMVLMRGASEAWSERKIREVRNELNNLSFYWGGEKIKIRGSIGVSEVDSTMSVEEILDKADKKMYEDKEGKKAGRPVLIVSNPIVPAP